MFCVHTNDIQACRTLGVEASEEKIQTFLFLIPRIFFFSPALEITRGEREKKKLFHALKLLHRAVAKEEEAAAPMTAEAPATPETPAAPATDDNSATTTTSKRLRCDERLDGWVRFGFGV